MNFSSEGGLSRLGLVLSVCGKTLEQAHRKQMKSPALSFDSVPFIKRRCILLMWTLHLVIPFLNATVEDHFISMAVSCPLWI